MKRAPSSKLPNLAWGTVSSKGQVTIPVRIARPLGLKRGDKVTFRAVKGRIQIRPVSHDKAQKRKEASSS